MPTGINWTDETWNPATGCTFVSEGCINCYAAEISNAMERQGVAKYRNGFSYTEHMDAVRGPLKWKNQKKIFVNSMSDFFHEKATEQFTHACLDMMRMVAPQHIYQILTKRPARAIKVVKAYCKANGMRELPQHIWMGVSVENERTTGRIDLLRKVPCVTRFISFEPLIGPVGPVNLAGIDWAIIGGESGVRHRVMRKEWPQDIMRQCRQQDVPIWFKQWGGIKHDSGGRTINNRTYDEFPKYLEGPQAAGQMTLF